MERQPKSIKTDRGYQCHPEVPCLCNEIRPKGQFIEDISVGYTERFIAEANRMQGVLYKKGEIVTLARRRVNRRKPKKL